MIPQEVEALVREREAARASKDFARADALRDEIAALGFVVTDTPSGTVLERARAFEVVDAAGISNSLSEPPTRALSFHVLYERFLEDLSRFLGSLERHNDLSSSEVVVVDAASRDGEAIEEIVSHHETARALHLDRELGWAAARNAGLKQSKGSIIVLVDLSIEPAGDIVSPLLDAFQEPTVGVAGPLGLVSENMRLWADSPGPEVDAIEGYLLATRRELLAGGLICEKFRWYRNADIDLSFQLRALGYRAVVVPLPLRRHTHRAWDALDENERAKRSKRNHYVFFDRWKHRPDLLIAGPRGVR